MGVGDIFFVELFGYELCFILVVFFDNYMWMRIGDKVELIYYLVKFVFESVVLMFFIIGLWYVIDGGGLFYKFVWLKNFIYVEICVLYVWYVRSSYVNVMVVFDGYYGFSVKDEVYWWRVSNDVGVIVFVIKEMCLMMFKKVFFGNVFNK